MNDLDVNKKLQLKKKRISRCIPVNIENSSFIQNRCQNDISVDIETSLFSKLIVVWKRCWIFHIFLYFTIKSSVSVSNVMFSIVYSIYVLFI